MSKQDKNCQVPTPTKYVRQMLDYIGYQHDLWGHKVLENSCGEGNILIEIVKRYIADAREKGYASYLIVQGLQVDIIAYEVDQEKIDICLKRLNALASSENLPQIKWNIKNQDFLKSEEKNVEFIIGNPPYITYHDLTKEEREFLKDTYFVCRKGRFDYCYAFIEASVRALADNGKMAYLIPFSIFRNKFAAELRGFLKKYITRIMDYKNINVFPRIACSNAVIICEKKGVSNQIEYEDILEKRKLMLNREDIDGKKWIFCRNGEGNRRFGDYFSIHNSVATLCNKAFLFTVKEEQEQYYIIDKMLVEKDITFPAVSTKKSSGLTKDKSECRIIFPYKRANGLIFRFEENEFRNQYPCAWEYLNQYQKELKNRKADENAKWFEYGRSQALASVFGEKLIMPMVITNSAKIYYAGVDAVPYAGYFIMMKPDSSMTLQDAKEILESVRFYHYVKAVGTPTTISSFRVSVYDISEFTF